MRRRTLLGVSAALASGVIRLTPLRPNGPWRFFTPSEAGMVDAICEQLIPADRDPGAKVACVVHYIDIQLTRAFRKHRQSYRNGLAQVDFKSRTKFGRPFVELTAGQQIDVLRDVERDFAPFFTLLLAHTHQGFYGDPRHGGNRDRVSWKMLGLPYPPVRGRQHYEGA